MGVAKPGNICRVTGMGLGLVCQDAVGRVYGWFLKRTKQFLLYEPSPLAGYLDSLLELLTSTM
jgi:hypothetical protein